MNFTGVVFEALKMQANIAVLRNKVKSLMQLVLSQRKPFFLLTLLFFYFTGCLLFYICLTELGYCTVCSNITCLVFSIYHIQF